MIMFIYPSPLAVIIIVIMLTIAAVASEFPMYGMNKSI